MSASFGCEIQTVYYIQLLEPNRYNRKPTSKIKTEPNRTEKNLNRGSPTGFPSYTPVVRIECRVRDSVRVKVWIGTVLGIVLEYIGQNKIRPPSSPKEKCVYLIFELLLDSRSSVFS